MRIVDALWGSGLPSNVAHRQVTSFTTEEAVGLMDEGGVDAAVIHPMHTYLRQIYDAFGPARIFWGTDITKMPCSWRQCVTMFTEELPWLSGREKELVMGQAVCDWWGGKEPS